VGPSTDFARRRRARQHDGVLAVLLPPSEGKAPDGDGPGWDPGDGVFGPRLARPRTAVATALRRAKGGDEKLLGVKGPALERARAANRTVVGAPTLPAWRRYTGVVWDHLDIAGLDRRARTRAADAVVVVSGMAGLVALDDPLPDHRLKLGVRLGALGRVDAFWRADLSAALDDHLAGRTVVDLLPKEHAAAWTPDPTRYRLLRVRFVEAGGRVGGHTAKAAKGLLARALLASRDPDAVLEGWRHDAFHLEVTHVTG
jgi:hypothetical protein